MISIPYQIILASQSPRRKQLLEQLDLPFTVKTKNTDESFPDHLKAQEIPIYLSQKKADAFMDELAADELLITADTVVCLQEKVLNKPENTAHAQEMLRMLSGQKHQVFTGVSLSTREKRVSFYDETSVHFNHLSDEEINYYIEHYKPFDKAGSYGAQDWIGLMGVNKIEGTYFNVMGLPVAKLYHELKTNFQSR
jgi:septum formation protein